MVASKDGKSVDDKKTGCNNMKKWNKYRCPSCGSTRTFYHEETQTKYYYCEYCVDDSGDYRPFGNGMLQLHRVVNVEIREIKQ